MESCCCFDLRLEECFADKDLHNKDFCATSRVPCSIELDRDWVDCELSANLLVRSVISEFKVPTSLFKLDIICDNEDLRLLDLSSDSEYWVSIESNCFEKLFFN